MDIYCKTCMHRFRLKTDYDKHLICCEFFHKIRKNKMETDELGTKLPTQKEMYMLIRELTLKCEKLENKVKNLENNVGKKQKVLIDDLLNHKQNMPMMTFKGLYNMCVVTRSDLMKVYNSNLTEGIKQVLTPVVKSIKEKSPIRAFSQRKRQIYVFDIVDEMHSDVPVWSKMTSNIMSRAITHIGQLFLKEHVKWENEQDECENSNFQQPDDIFEKSIKYRKKVNGTGIVASDQNRELRDWLYDTIEETLKQICEIDFE